MDITHLIWESPSTSLLSAVAVGLAVVAFGQWRTSRKFSVFPKPSGSLPFLGHALELTKMPWVKMQRWCEQFPGQLVCIDFLMQTGVLVCDPEHIRRILDKKQRKYSKDLEMSYKPFMHILGRGIITSHGDTWKAKRALVAHAFRVEILEETADVAKRAVDRLSAKLEKLKGTGQTVEIAEEFRVLTLQVIGELILSLTPEESGRVFPELYLPIVEEANLRIWNPFRAWYLTPTNWHYHKTVNALNTYIADLIRKRWAQRVARLEAGEQCDHPDILERIFDSIEPADWCEDIVLGLRDEMKSFVLAGHETSASMLTWALHELLENKDCYDRFLAEGRAVFSSCRGTPTDTQDCFQTSPLPPTSEVNKLTYTVNTLKETLRRYSLVPVVTRISDEGDKLDGKPIPANSKMFIVIKRVHEDPKYWPEPLKFKPERFDEPYHPFAFLAFINGPRNCLGQHLALLEARIVLSLLMQRFKFRARDDKVGEIHEFMVPVCPKNGMHLYVE